MEGWMIIYLAILIGLCYLATASELEGSFTRGLVLFIIVFLSFWTIGRIIVNPEKRIWAVLMLVGDLTAVIYLLMCRKR